MNAARSNYLDNRSSGNPGAAKNGTIPENRPKHQIRKGNETKSLAEV